MNDNMAGHRRGDIPDMKSGRWTIGPVDELMLMGIRHLSSLARVSFVKGGKTVVLCVYRQF